MFPNGGELCEPLFPTICSCFSDVNPSILPLFHSNFLCTQTTQDGCQTFKVRSNLCPDAVGSRGSGPPRRTSFFLYLPNSNKPKIPGICMISCRSLFVCHEFLHCQAALTR